MGTPLPIEQIRRPLPFTPIEEDQMAENLSSRLSARDADQIASSPFVAVATDMGLYS